MNKLGIFVAAVVVALGGFWITQDNSATPSDQPNAAVAAGALASVIVPDQLSDNAAIGKRAFEANCAACHAVNAAGQDGVAPPLIHKIYEPSHHGDESFQRAVALGVRSHHWPFGDMPAVDGVGRADVTYIIAYIRELQRANGIQ